MKYNYSYNLDSNSNLVPISSIEFDPIKEEHRYIVEKEIRIFRAKHKREFIKAMIFSAVFVVLIIAGIIMGIKYSLIFFPVLGGISIVFLTMAIIWFLSSTRFKVLGIKEGIVTHRETHQYYVDGHNNNVEHRSSDRVTIRIADTGKEVSIPTDAYTQMHCVPDDKVWLLKTTSGPVISFDR